MKQLAYRGRPLAGGTYLVTPIGSYRIMIASEHGDADAGWERVGDRSSVAIPSGAAVASQQQVKEGFVAAESDSPRPRGVPVTWAYLGDAIDPGWVAPERLTELDFVMRHPAKRFRGTSQDPHVAR